MCPSLPPDGARLPIRSLAMARRRNRGASGLAALLAIVMLPRVALADDRHNEPAPAPAGTGAQQPAPAPAPAQLQPPVSPAPPLRIARPAYLIGFGAGSYTLSPTGAFSAFDGDPAVVIQGRHVSMLNDHFGFEYVPSLVFQDWRTIADIYKWYFTDTDDEPDTTNVDDKLIGGWLGLILAPLAGANYCHGVGAIFYTSPDQDSFFVDAGGELDLLLRPSDPDLPVDLAFGLYLGFGYEFSPSLALSVRTRVVDPLFHETEARAITFAATLDFLRY